MRRGLCRRKYGGVTRLIRGMRLARGGTNRGGGVEMEMEMEREKEREGAGAGAGAERGGKGGV